MTNFTFYRDRDNGSLVGFRAEDHAGFAAYGSDVVCAGISALTINAVNSISTLTDDRCEQFVSAENTVIELRIKDIPSVECDILLKSLELGIKSISNSYRGHVKVDYSEV